MSETSTKPYLIRAIHEWCGDNGYTPYLAVAVDEHTQVPREFVKNGEIVLNVSSMATHRLTLGNELISFQARFGGISRELSIPVENVTAIYARENGHGMAFDVPKALALVPTGDDGADAADAGEAGEAGEAGGPGEAPTPVGGAKPASGRPRKGRSVAPVLSIAPSQSSGGSDASDTPGSPDEPDPAPPSPSGGRPRSAKPKLTRVK
jgi:stringent starvation protein B